MERIAFVGPLQLAHLEGYQQGYGLALKEVLKGDNIAVPNFSDLVLGGLLQAGIDRIETLIDNLGSPTNAFIKERVVIKNRKEWGLSFMLAHRAVSKFVPALAEKGRARQDLADVGHLVGFLADLFYSMHVNRPLIILSGLPKIEALSGSLPAAIFVPLSDFFDRLEPLRASGVRLSSSVDVRSVAVLQNILAGELFAKYKESHEKLSDPKLATKDSLVELKSATRALCSKADKLIAPTNIAASLLPIASKAIEQLFGVLPGAVATELEDLISPWITANKKVVIYDLKKSLSDVCDKNNQALFGTRHVRGNRQVSDGAGA